MTPDEMRRELHELTESRGGYVVIGVHPEDERSIVEWWVPELVCPSWTQGDHLTQADAMAEALERLHAMGVA